VLVSEFNYSLPPSLIAQEPLADRADSRLLWVSRASGELSDRGFSEFPELLGAGDLLVCNDSKVFPARLHGRRGGERVRSPRTPAAREFLPGKVEVLLTRRVAEDRDEWECLVRPGRKIGVGERLLFGDEDELEAEVVARGSFGERRIRFRPVADFFDRLDRLGHVPLPPYISRPDLLADRDRYQTVYARERGSVAAPTAGLHFTREILSRIQARGIETAQITLHVGLGTFQPVRVERVEDHQLHREICQISSAAAEAINRTLDAGRRVVAVGTTSARTLEYFASQSANGRVQPGTLEADIFIYPGYQFRVVGALLTNFHLPHSTLLMLVCAFGGKEHVLDAYRHAVEHAYRFYSYGDCMFLE
jgi:S-adenosylmethionine:tRNA ribosyltransferase-isomerase